MFQKATIYIPVNIPAIFLLYLLAIAIKYTVFSTSESIHFVDEDQFVVEVDHDELSGLLTIFIIKVST